MEYERRINEGFGGIWGIKVRGKGGLVWRMCRSFGGYSGCFGCKRVQRGAKGTGVVMVRKNWTGNLYIGGANG